MTDRVTALVRQRAGAVVAVLALVAVGVGGAAYWWRHPTVFTQPDGVSLTAYAGVRDDQPSYVGVVNSMSITRHHETVTLTGGRVRLAGNSAGATATLVVCPPDGTGSRIGGAGPGDPSLSRCRPLRAGMRMHLPEDSLVAAVRVRRAGQVALGAVDVGYRRDDHPLHQSGTQRIATGIVVRSLAGRVG